MVKRVQDTGGKTAGATSGPLLLLQHVDQFLHGGGALVQHGLLFGGELDLVNLFDARGAQLDRNAHVEAVNAVLAFQIGGAGQHFFLVLEDGLGHL